MRSLLGKRRKFRGGRWCSFLGFAERAGRDEGERLNLNLLNLPRTRHRLQSTLVQSKKGRD
jgi:hypothetical protein